MVCTSSDFLQLEFVALNVVLLLSQMTADMLKSEMMYISMLAVNGLMNTAMIYMLMLMAKCLLNTTTKMIAMLI